MWLPPGTPRLPWASVRPAGRLQMLKSISSSQGFFCFVLLPCFHVKLQPEATSRLTTSTAVTALPFHLFPHYMHEMCFEFPVEALGFRMNRLSTIPELPFLRRVWQKTQVTQSTKPARRLGLGVHLRAHLERKV